MSLEELLERICHNRSDHESFRASLLTLATANALHQGKGKNPLLLWGSNSFLTPLVIGLCPEA